MHLVYHSVHLSTLPFYRHCTYVPGITMYRRSAHRFRFPNSDDDDELLVLYDDFDDPLLDAPGSEGIQAGHLQLDQLLDTGSGDDVEPLYYTHQENDDTDIRPVAQQTQYRSPRGPIDNDVELRETYVLPDTQEEEEKHNRCCDKLTSGYAWFLAKCPYIPIIMTFVLLVALSALSYYYYPPPDFSEDPSKGFETRGTYISKAQSTMLRLKNDVLRQKRLTYRPDISQVAHKLGISETILEQYLGKEYDTGGRDIPVDINRRRRSANVIETSKHHFGVRNERIDDWDSRADIDRRRRDINWIDTSERHFDVDDRQRDTKVGRRRRNINTVQATKRNSEESHSREKRQSYDKVSCGCDYRNAKCLLQNPTFVFEPVNEERDLFTVKAMHSMCKFQDDLLSPQTKDVGNTYCEAKSIATIIARLSRKRCQDLTQVDLDYAKNLIETCGQYVYNNMTQDEMKRMPAMCSVYNRHVVTDILINIAQIGFFDIQTESMGRLEYAATYLNGYYYDETQFFYDNFEGRTVGDDQVKISAVKFHYHYDVKWDLLGKYLISDLLYFGVALGLVFFIMFLYLRSIVLMLTTLLNVIVSFITAYFIYYFVCRMTFFPYLNLLAGLVLIAVGADDMFIFYDCWEHAKAEDPNARISKIIEKTLHHAALSVFVTSFTTSSAFFANALSNITAIQDFAIFAGICILVNLFYMITLTPSVIVCIEWFYRLYLKSAKFRALDAKVDKVTKKLHELSVVIFHRIFPKIIDTTWFLWVFLLLMQGIGACIVVFVYPKFQLPNSKDFQLFPASNVIENWDLTMRTKFQSVLLNEKDTDDRIRFYYVLGVHPDDPGNHLDPDDTGEDVLPTLDQTFDIADPDTQVFIYNLCHELLKQPFMPDHVPLTCQLDAILEVLKVYCSKLLVTMTGCCPHNMAIPIDGKMLEKCAAAYQLLLYRTEYGNDTSFGFGSIIGDFLFDRNDTSVEAYAMFVQTKFVPTFAHDKMAEYNKQVKGFLDHQLSDGPKGINSGFVAYTDWFWFYDLQLALANGTFSSILLSLAVAGMVMLIMSQNVLIFVYAMVTICFAITCTVAVLVFLGWELNIIESLIISLAVGLSIDFTIHFGVAYRLSRAETSHERTEVGFRTVGAAVAMAALTTFFAGIAVMPCEVLIYIKLGIFLMLVMTFSWLYSNFFFQSLCHIVGPSKQCHTRCMKGCCCAGCKSCDKILSCLGTRGSYTINGNK